MQEKYLKLYRTIIYNLRFLPRAIGHRCKKNLRQALGKPGRPVQSRLVFVISFPRSGTTALGSLLQQPEAKMNYHGEFFAFNHWSQAVSPLSKTYPLFSLRFFIGHFRQKRKWKYYCYEASRLSPDKTMSAIMEIPGDHVFKIFPFHLSDKALTDLIEKYRPDIMFLRRNHLDRLVSHRKAMATGTWHGVATEGVEVEIPVKLINKYMEDYVNFYTLMKKTAVASECKIIDIEYEHLFEPETTKKVLEFITGDPARVAALNIKPRTLKQDTQDLSQQAFFEKLAKEGIQKEISDFDFRKIEV
ncbi:unannotated protein [freshwater metagenome]|uniref:Unannotated protein n=2 Tax=freshwater metagenome TaxID=449393 RepID=A0A6J6BX00_9ZZZZ|nr:hypothetical protein [Actinomycetota bacterium]MSY82875.1 hypothetical protein [Actinomycetota bacterium]MTA05180.1 hypothetical protein [Actinomycetota bacterium]MTA22794.1 hypothetical protein [Actinomycetota bacterium]